MGRLGSEVKEIGFDAGGVVLVKPAAQGGAEAGANSGIHRLIAEQDGGSRLSENTGLGLRSAWRAGGQERGQAVSPGPPEQKVGLKPHPAGRVRAALARTPHM